MEKTHKPNARKNETPYHVIEKVRELQRYFSRDPYALVSSSQLLKEIIRSPERFEAIYSLLQDVESKETFKWFIKYRVAYACIGNRASMLYPPPIDFYLWERYLKDIEAAKVGKDLWTCPTLTDTLLAGGTI